MVGDNLRRIKTIPSFEKIMLIIMGFVGTAPILQIKGITFFTFFVFFMIFYVGIEAIKKDKISLNKECMFYFLIFVSSCISAVVCFKSDIPYFWKDVQIKNLLWVVLFLVIFVLYASEKKYKMVNI